MLMMRNEVKQIRKGVTIVKKMTICFVLFTLLCSCENLVTDLPTTTTEQFIDKPTPGIVTFPKGTKAIDIYNTVVALYPDNKWHKVTDGNWNYVKSTTTTMTTNGPVTTEAYETVSFSQIRHIHTSTDPEINIHTVYLYSSDSNIRRLSSSGRGKLPTFGRMM
jgi:protoporphyrinogen oxidase